MNFIFYYPALIDTTTNLKTRFCGFLMGGSICGAEVGMTTVNMFDANPETQITLESVQMLDIPFG